MSHIALSRGRRPSVRPLFDGFPGLHGVLDSAFEGVNGELFVDDAHTPRVAHIVLDDFHCVAGDPDAPGAREALLTVPPDDHIAAPEEWSKTIEATRRVEPYDRFAFRAPERWDRARLTALRESLPAGFVLQRVTPENVRAFEELAESLVANFGTHERFLSLGVGFGITEKGGSRFVAGCASYTISSRSLEFEIQTHPDYQRRGLALVTGARMIEHCLDTDLEPCWDAAHEGSALLAERLGFVGRRRYTAYRVL